MKGKHVTTVYVTHKRYTVHNLSGHPEHAGRVEAIWNDLKDNGLAERMIQLEPEPVTDEQILSVHTQEHLDNLHLISHADGLTRFDSDTYALPETPEIARLSAGGVVKAVDEVMNGNADNGLAIVRPPGHHAVSSKGMGFCILGNVAMAARHAQQKYNLGRVLIVDYDVHHGNGTQDMFYDDNSVLFISTHQHPFYPGSGTLEQTGQGKGKGYTLNIPLSMGNADANYAKIYKEIIWESAKRFKPELIIVSAGFDAHWTDPLASMNLSLTGYAHITRELIRMAQSLCGGKIIFSLEGGYDLSTLAYGIRNVAHALLGDDTVFDPLGRAKYDEPNISNLLLQIKQLHNL